MLRPTSSARRWPFALTLALLGACADQVTAPLEAPGDPSAAIIEPNVVSNTNDAGIGSLRWTLSWTTGGETIRFDPSLAGQTIALDSVIYVKKPVTIEGPAGAGITIDARAKGRVFRVQRPATLTLRNLTITGGLEVGSSGGAIYSDSALVLDHVLVHGNSGGSGSIIYSEDDVTLVNSSVSANTSPNVSTSNFGAVMGDTVALINSTVADNPYGGVGAPVTFGHVILHNAILANNGGENCTGYSTVNSIARQGANISDDDTCGGPTQIMIGDPEIGPLANNGGPTRTHALLPGSPAIDAGSSCTEAVDQRYTPRDAKCDLGAFEFTDFTTVNVTIDPSASVSQSSGSAVLTGTLLCSRNATFDLAVQLVQQQKTGGKNTTTVDAANIVAVECTTTPRPWIASMVLTNASFQVGTASATAQTVSTKPGVTPTSVTGGVKLFWGRK